MKNNCTVKILIQFFFISYLFIGILIFRDYGVSWDEEMNRIGTALPEFNFIFHQDTKGLLESSEKYHGPSFELLLLSMERVTGVTDLRQIYFLRHFITFFFFWLSSLFLFLLTRKIFVRNGIAMLCVLMYVLSPKIFGESFCNSKDIGCLSFFTISLYTLHRFLTEKTFRSGFIHSLVTGFMIDVRITGLIMPIVTVVALIPGIISSNGKINISGKKEFIFISYLFLQTGFIILFWPVLWLNPLHHFHEAYVQMSNYPWNGKVIFMGNAISSHQLPWYYIPLWILISVPVLYSLFFVTGIVSAVKLFLKNPIRDLHDNIFLYSTIALVAIPVTSIIFLHSVVYDGWRHLYFIYAPFIVVAGYGADYIYSKISSPKGRKAISIIFSLQFGYVIFILGIDHPNQHVYFNLPARLAFSPVTQNFDADFWGMSYRKGLEDILSKDTSAHIHLRVENDPGIFNLEILTPEQRARVSFHGELHETDYWLAEFRGRIVDPQKVNAKIFGQVMNSSGTLLTIYKGLREESAREELFQSENNFDNKENGTNISKSVSSSGCCSNILLSNQTSDPVYFTSGKINDEEVEEVEMKFMVNPVDHNPNAIIVLSVMRGTDVIFWNKENLQNRLNAPGQWTPFKWNVTFTPDMIHEGDVISAYVWNLDKSEIFVDDFRMTVVRYTVGKPVNYFPQ